jgi:Fe-S-cluster-containing hydrogenase component 2
MVSQDSCTGCGLCAKACQIDAIAMTAIGQKKIAQVDEAVCLGCGLCLRACPRKCITLQKSSQSIITPSSSVHRIVLMAIEKGMLQELIFDNKALFSHRAMAAILSAILKMPPIKQMMASEQMRSVYLEKLISRQSLK